MLNYSDQNNRWCNEINIKKYSIPILSINYINEMLIKGPILKRLNSYLWLSFIFVYQKSVKRTSKTGTKSPFASVFSCCEFFHKGYFVVKNWCKMFIWKISGIQILFMITILIWFKGYVQMINAAQYSQYKQYANTIIKTRTWILWKGCQPIQL